MADLSLYVHFPWCVRKCPYCDFNSHPIRGGSLDTDRYLDALQCDLQTQLDELGEPPRLETVFFGGGTPSLLPPAAFEQLLALLEPNLAADAEITMEANPGTTEHHDLEGYRAAGINRLSLGAQSFADDKLAALGRIHGAADVYRSLELARAAGFDNINLDLMYGLPEQNQAEAAADLREALHLNPEHLSWYQLTLEPKTEFARRPPHLPADEELADMEVCGYELLSNAGFERYEVSAFARPGRRCLHNLNYWTFGEYLGIGAGAHGRLGMADPLAHRRTRKAHQPRVYLSAPTDTRVEPVGLDELAAEFMLNALRLVDGVPTARFELATGLPLTALEPTRSRQVSSGLLRADRLAATARGYAMLDSLIQDYL